MMTWPAPVDVLPHRPPMVYLDRVVSHDASRTVCRVEITESAPFLDENGLVPSWVGLEYMAQCVAAHAGLVAHACGEPVRLGLLIGARRVSFHTDALTPGHTILVTAVHTWGDHSLGSFACTMSDERSERLLAEGVLNVYSPPDGVPGRLAS